MVATSGELSPPTMLQTLWWHRGAFFARGRVRAVGADPEDDPDLFMIDFDPFDQGTDDLAAGQPIRCVQTSFDLSRKRLQATRQERQFRLQPGFISRLLDLGFPVPQALAQARQPWFKLRFVSEPLGGAVNQACYSPFAPVPPGVPAAQDPAVSAFAPTVAGIPAPAVRDAPAIDRPPARQLHRPDRCAGACSNTSARPQSARHPLPCSDSRPTSGPAAGERSD